MAINLNDITNTIHNSDRAKELSETKGGRELLKNITRQYLLSAVDRTAGYKNPPHHIEKFKKAFSDIQRPNRFEVLFTDEKNTFFNDQASKTLTPLIKAITIPQIVTNQMSFKRAGKTINIPLNQDVADQIDITVYQDIDNNAYANIMTLLNPTQSEYHVRFSEENSNVSLSFLYTVDINTNSADNYSILDQTLDFIGVDFFDKYHSSADKKFVKKSLSKNIKSKILELKFNNAYISSLKTSDGDMERIDNYSDITMSLKFSGMELFSWDWREIGEKGEANYQNSRPKEGYQI